MIATVLSLFAQLSGTNMATPERSFIMIKPDGVHRNLVGEIVSRFEKKGFRLVAMKFVQVGDNDTTAIVPVNVTPTWSAAVKTTSSDSWALH